MIQSLQASKIANKRKNKAIREARQLLISPRERQVLNLMYLGCSNAEIARKLRINWHTASTYYGNLRHKFGARNRTQLMAMAVEKGYVGNLSATAIRCAILEDFLRKVTLALPKEKILNLGN